MLSPHLILSVVGVILKLGAVCCFSKICIAAICSRILVTEKIHSNVGIFLVNEMITVQKIQKILK